jgi:MFS family permease
LNIRKPNAGETFHGLWNRPFLLLNLSYFLVFSNISLFYLYPLALEDMGARPEIIGWVMGFFSVATVLSRPLMGKLVGSKGEFFAMWVGIAVVFVATTGYLFLEEIGPRMFFVRLVHGVGYSAYISGSFSLVARAVLPETQGEAYGMVGASIMAATAIAPSLGEVLLRKSGFGTLYLTASACAIFAFTVIWFSGAGKKRHTRGETDEKVRYLPLLRDTSFLFLMVSTLIFAHCQSTLVNFLALISVEKGVGPGHFFFVAFCTAIMVLLTMGRVMDRFGKRVFLKTAYPVLALGLSLIPGLIVSWSYLLPALLCGAGMGFLFPAHNALAAGYGTRGQKPAAMSFFTSVYDTGFITGAVFSGWIAQMWGLSRLFVFAGTLALGGLAIGLFSPLGESGVRPANSISNSIVNL